MFTWNPWHGCRKISAGCQHCYVYRIDGRHGRDASEVTRTASFDMPVRRNRKGGYKIPSGQTVFTCFSSDFFLPEADRWRPEAWKMMRTRRDLQFLFITKRIDRLAECTPPDWGAGYPNVTICCTVENQERADYRLPIYRDVPVRHKIIVCEPLLGPVDLTRWLAGGWVEEVIVGGESGPEARVCDFAWVLSLRDQCRAAGVRFTFRQTGAVLLKDGRLYRIPRPFQHSQARKAGIDLR
ncbi:DUF5131 family protein [uncultured Rikenella sp.]|uniref:DUF5131 family protein n=1 Tax=uncultured Rikenella sp. TaxID=368003 RepID=UPI002636F454|nr:DUF5131 family protein [uncultured Rikenella sp.]